jgi:hypothetical protein
MLEFKKSTRKGKKYMVYYNKRWIHFGDNSAQQFRDRTPLRLYSNLDHLDPVRQKSYLARARGIKDKAGNLTYLNKNSPNFYSYHFLWS